MKTPTLHWTSYYVVSKRKINLRETQKGFGDESGDSQNASSIVAFSTRVGLKRTNYNEMHFIQVLVLSVINVVEQLFRFPKPVSVLTLTDNRRRTGYKLGCI